jgi:predicted small integral membrane protein
VCHASLIAYNTYMQASTEAPLPVTLRPGHIIAVYVYCIQVGLRKFEVHIGVYLIIVGFSMFRCISCGATIFRTLKMKALRFFEMSVNVYQLTWRNVPEEWNLQLGPNLH